MPGRTVNPLPRGREPVLSEAEGVGALGAPREGELAPAGRSRRGPKTPRGKRAVSRNAIKHAIFAKDPVVIAGLETIEEWEEFEAAISAAWSPVDAYDRELVYDIAFGLWRLRRCRHQEAAQLTRQIADAERELIEEANPELFDDDEDDDDEEGDGPGVDPIPPPASGLSSSEAKEGGQGVGSSRPARRLRPVSHTRLRAGQLLNVIPDGYAMDRSLRYETHVRRALLQSVHELEARQARRLGEQPPLARVDFNASPSLRRPGVRDSSAFDQLNAGLARGERHLARCRRALRLRAADDDDGE